MDNLPKSRYSGALESMPHLINKICALWPGEEVDLFISQLVMDSRDGARQGLPVAAAEELLFLAQTNKIVRAIDRARHFKISLGDAYRSIDAADQERHRGAAEGERRATGDPVMRRHDGAPAPAAAARRRRAEIAHGPIALLGQLVLRIATSRVMVILIIIVLAARLAWPFIATVLGLPQP